MPYQSIAIPKYDFPSLAKVLPSTEHKPSALFRKHAPKLVKGSWVSKRYALPPLTTILQPKFGDEDKKFAKDWFERTHSSVLDNEDVVVENVHYALKKNPSSDKWNISSALRNEREKRVATKTSLKSRRNAFSACKAAVNMNLHGIHDHKSESQTAVTKDTFRPDLGGAKSPEDLDENPFEDEKCIAKAEETIKLPSFISRERSKYTWEIKTIAIVDVSKGANVEKEEVPTVTRAQNEKGYPRSPLSQIWNEQEMIVAMQTKIYQPFRHIKRRQPTPQRNATLLNRVRENECHNAIERFQDEQWIKITGGQLDPAQRSGVTPFLYFD